MNGFRLSPRHSVRATDQPTSADSTLCFSKLEPEFYLEVLNIQEGVFPLSCPQGGKNQPFSFSIRQEKPSCY